MKNCNHCPDEAIAGPMACQVCTRGEEKRKDAFYAAMLLESLYGNDKQKSREFFICQSWKQKEAIAREVLGSRYEEMEAIK